MKPILAKPTKLFPCCICGKPREVRTTKKGKPYVHCDPCGLQMFVRIESGIRHFEALCDQADNNHIWQRLAELEHRYEFECPKCGKRFWLTEELIKTSWLGKLEGYRCPEKGCDGVVKPEQA
jgi:transcription elongation factor Elf1